MPSPLIEFRDWSIRLPGGDRPALHGVSLSIAVGERVLVTGPSGGGKSSLIRAIANLHDRDSTVATGELMSRIRTVGFVGQEPDEQILFPTVGEEIAFVAETTVSSADKVERRIRESLRATRITTPLSHRTSNLSGGEKQRLAIASALAGKPDILVMDEPTASLDEASIQLVVQSVERVLSKPRSTMVIVEHHIEVWRHLVDRIIVIADGEVVADGPIDDVLTKRRSMLIALGVWLPNHTAAPKPTRPRKKATTVMSVRGLVARRSPTADLVSIPDFDLAEGEVVALVGPNGSGKSTALRALGGLLEPLDGSVRYSGDSRPPHTLRATELIHHVGSVLQNPAYGFGVGRVNDEAPAHERAAVGLKGLDNRHPQSLSGGERRRLGLASALSRRPRILFLDEPSFGQDANSWLDLIDRLRDFLEGRGAIVVASHDHRLVASLAHRVIEIGGGVE